MRREEEFLTEGHKIVYRVWKRRLIEGFFVFLIGVFLGFFVVKVLSDTAMRREDKEKLKLIEKYRFEAFQTFKDGERLMEYLRYLDREKEKIEGKYPFLINPVQVFLFDYGGRKVIYFVISILPFIGAVAGFIVFHRYLSKLDRGFFYQEAPYEKPYEKAEIKYKFFVSRLGKYEKSRKGIVDATFRNVEELLMLMNFGAKGNIDERKERKMILEKLKRISEHAKKYYPHEDRIRLLLFCEVLMWHSVINRVGNVPTGLISKYIKDYTLKRMLSLYQRRHLPVLFVGGKIMERELEPYIFLRIFYEVVEDVEKRA